MTWTRIITASVWINAKTPSRTTKYVHWSPSPHADPPVEYFLLFELIKSSHRQELEALTAETCMCMYYILLETEFKIKGRVTFYMGFISNHFDSQLICS